MMKAIIHTTDGITKMTRKRFGFFKRDYNERETNLVVLYPNVLYQEVQGFGAAITQAVGSVLTAAGGRDAEKILKKCFQKNGLNYKYLRVPVDSCDFSDRSYSSFSSEGMVPSLEMDDKYIIPYIHKIYEIAGERIPVMLSPWSPPAFMKTNGSIYEGGHLKKEFYGEWAEYLCNYIQEYKKRGVLVRAISIQNEPHAVQKWESCIYTALEEKEFIEQNLYPSLMSQGLHDIEIYAWDHNKERLFERAKELVDENENSIITGFNFHWYSGDHFENVRLTHEFFPNKRLVFSEGCIEYNQYDRGNVVNAEKYAHDMIGNFNAGMDTFIDWNLVLNEKGGPNHKSNFCEAPIMYDTKRKEIIENISYQYIRHFSKYIQPGSRRIASSSFSNKIETASFANPDGSLVLIILNQNETDTWLYIKLYDELLKIKSGSHSIQTVVIQEK